MEESAEPSVVLSEDNEVSNKTGAGKPRTTRQSIKTYFTTEPQEKYYVAPNKPLLIDCNIVAADIVTFRLENCLHLTHYWSSVVITSSEDVNKMTDK